MGEREQNFRSREEADSYLLGEIANRGCAMMKIDAVPSDLRGTSLVADTNPQWRIDVKNLCSVLLYAPTEKETWIQLKPGEYLYQFYFGGEQATQSRGTAREILEAVDANLFREKGRQETRRELFALVEELQGAVRELDAFPSDLVFDARSRPHVSNSVEFGKVVRVDFPDRVVALLRRPEGRYFAGDFYLNGKLQGSNHDWSVGEVRDNVRRLIERARRERNAETR